MDFRVLCDDVLHFKSMCFHVFFRDWMHLHNNFLHGFQTCSCISMCCLKLRVYWFPSKPIGVQLIVSLLSLMSHGVWLVPTSFIDVLCFFPLNCFIDCHWFQQFVWCCVAFKNICVSLCFIGVRWFPCFPYVRNVCSVHTYAHIYIYVYVSDIDLYIFI